MGFYVRKGMNDMGNEIVISVQSLLWVCGAIITLGGATAVIARWLAPYKELKKKVGKNEAECAKIEGLKKELSEIRTEFERIQRNQKSDHTEIEKIETGIEKICKCTLALTDHELTGNSVDRLRAAKDEMNDFLIHK